MRNFKLCVAALLLAFTTATSAASISYTLGNHSEAGQYDGATNPYGLRLDDTGQTFTVGDNLPGTYAGAAVTLTYDPTDLATGAVLTGSMFENATGTAWSIDYTLSDLSAAPNGGFIAQSGSGLLSEVGGSGTFDLIGISDGTGVFIFDNDGHRLPGTSTGWVGRGWLEGASITNDFLVVGTPVPLPAAIWLMGAGLLGLFGVGRRK